MYVLLLNGEIPLTFKKIKKYDIGTGYLALYNDEKGILCRNIENETEYYENKSHLLYENAEEYILGNASVGKKVIIINNKLNGFSEADDMIDIIRNGILKMDTIKSKKKENMVRYYL